MTPEEVREIVARELFVATDAQSPAAYDRRKSRREWYHPRFTEEMRADWRTQADVFIDSLAASEIVLVPVGTVSR